MHSQRNATAASRGQARAPREHRRRRPREAAARTRSIRLSLTDEEFDEIGAAAASSGLARGAYAAQAALAAARGKVFLADSPLHQALSELIRSAGAVRRIGASLDRAASRMSAAGQRSADLLPYAAESFRKAERLDAAAEAVRRSLP